MTSDARDLDQLADDYLDELLEAETWNQAQLQHGNALDEALEHARRRRACVAALPRPTFDASLRDRLILAVPKSQRKAIPFPAWFFGLGSLAAAAALVVIVFSTDTHPVQSVEPTLAKAAKPAESTIQANELERRQGFTTAPMNMEGAASEKSRVVSAEPLASNMAQANSRRASRVADEVSEIQALQSQAQANADQLHKQTAISQDVPQPHELLLAWVDTSRSKDHETLESADFAAPMMDAAKRDEKKERGDAPQKVRSVMPVAPGMRAAAQEDAAPFQADSQEAGPQKVAPLDAAPQAVVAQQTGAAPQPATAPVMAEAALTAPVAEAEHDAAPRTLELLLQNRTVTPWVLDAEHIRIEALDSQGHVIWRGRILAEGQVDVAAGAEVRLRIDAGQWPAQTASLRAVADQAQSSNLPLNPQ